MSNRYSRRNFLGAALAAGVLPILPGAVGAAPRVPKRLVAGTRVLEVNGRPTKVFALIGPDGRSGIRLAPGERFRVDLANEAGTRTIVHWHGQLPPWTQDGFPWPETPPIANGAVQAYDYAPIPGTYWMHSHEGLQEQRLMTAPLIVHDVAELREDRQEVVLMLHDFTFRTPDEVLARLTGRRVAAGRAVVQKSDEAPGGQGGSKAPESPMLGMAAHAPDTGMSGMGMSAMATSGSGGMQMDLNDVDYDAFLANDRTLSDPEIVRVEGGDRIRLRIINGASATQFWIDLGALTGTVVAVDGFPVRPVQATHLPLAIAQRLDVLIDLPGNGPYPILAQVEGKRARTGIVLAASGAPLSRLASDAEKAAPPVDLSLEQRLEAATPLTPRAPDVTHRVTLDGSMAPYTWSMNGENWPNVTPLMIAPGQRVAIEMVNRSMMAHPMHLHGHAFQVTALNGTSLAGAVRDTVLVPPMGSVTVAFDADNPGRWALHCHILYHMATGMITEVRYPGII